MEPEITIIIPVWDTYVRFLSAYIHHLKKQNISVKILIINNASKTPLPQIRSKNTQTIVLPTRVTVGEARNIGLRQVTTPYVSFHDVDDEILPHTLQKLKKQLDKNPRLVLATAHTYKENEAGQRWLRKLPAGSFWLGKWPAAFAIQQLNFNIVMTNGATLIRTDIAKQTGGFGDMNYGGDWLFSSALCLRGPIKINRWVGLVWKQHQDSLWHRKQTKEMLMDNRRQLLDKIMQDHATPKSVKLMKPLFRFRHQLRINHLLRGKAYVVPETTPNT